MYNKKKCKKHLFKKYGKDKYKCLYCGLIKNKSEKSFDGGLSKIKKKV